MRFRKTRGPLAAIVGKLRCVYRFGLLAKLALGGHGGFLLVLWYLVPLGLNQSEAPAEVFDLKVGTCVRTGVLLVLLLKEHAFEVEEVEGLLLWRRLLSLELACARLLAV